jgi:hypothetical protein
VSSEPGRAVVRPVTAELLASLLVERILGLGADGRVRVLLDGAAAAAPDALADALVEPLRVAGRAVVRVHADDFLRPASVRLEHGRHDPDGYLEDRLDTRALVREVLDPLGPAGSGRYLPALWDATRDRATRASYEEAGAGAVLLLDGELLLGRGLPCEVEVHLAMRRATLERRGTPPWQLDAFERYDDEVRPQEVADVVVRVDDPRHPALVERT